MTVLHLPVAKPTTLAQWAESTAEAIHLRRLIESQPACLMRVGINGVLLAANDAALSLLGAANLGQALGASVTTWIVPEHHEQWREFAATIETGTRNSFECDLKDLGGTTHSIVVHGVPLLDHSDGVPSMIVGVRDASAVRRLEGALRESESQRPEPVGEHQPEPGMTPRQQQQLVQLLKEGRTHLRQLRAQLEEATAERDRLATQLSEHDAAQQQPAAGQQQLELLLKEQEWRQSLETLQAQLEQASIERDQLAMELSGEESAHQQLVAELTAERSRHQHEVSAAALKQKESDKAFADCRVELESLTVMANQLAPLAAAGRSALEVGRELLSTIATLDDRSASLLATCPVESASRKEIEELRGEAIRAGSLARQILHAHSQAVETPSERAADGSKPFGHSD